METQAREATRNQTSPFAIVAFTLAIVALVVQLVLDAPFIGLIAGAGGCSFRFPGPPIAW